MREVLSEGWELVQDPALVGQRLVRPANQVESLAELIVVQRDLADSQRGNEAIDV